MVVECSLEPADGRADEPADRATDFHVRAAADPGRFFPVGSSVLRRTVPTQLRRSGDRVQRLVETA